MPSTHACATASIMTEEILQIRNLTVDLPVGGDRLHAVQDLSLSLRRDEIVITSYSIHYTKLYECSHASTTRARSISRA